MIRHYVSLVILFVLILGAIIYGFNSSGSPSNVRKIKFDTERVRDISSLKNTVAREYQFNSTLPTSYESLISSIETSRLSVSDPETDAPYGYSVTGLTSYKLCATFSLSTLEDENSQKNNYLSYYENEFRHPAGYYCFDLEVTPRILPISVPVPQPPVAIPTAKVEL